MVVDTFILLWCLILPPSQKELGEVPTAYQVLEEKLPGLDLKNQVPVLINYNPKKRKPYEESELRSNEQQEVQQVLKENKEECSG